MWDVCPDEADATARGLVVGAAGTGVAVAADTCFAAAGVDVELTLALTSCRGPHPASRPTTVNNARTSTTRDIPRLRAANDNVFIDTLLWVRPNIGAYSQRYTDALD